MDEQLRHVALVIASIIFGKNMLKFQVNIFNGKIGWCIIPVSLAYLFLLSDVLFLFLLAFLI